ncbi:MAG TPA: hypothetical protein PKK59_09415 [Anaerolineaceae bacterium]|nr:hypothetical protein [Anaerolineaceae bacterium]
MIHDPSFRSILLDHAARYPAWQPQDVYKLSHQAVLGSQHAVNDREHARAWLQQELAALTAAPPELPDDPLIDSISEDGAIIRVHLRPLIRLGLSPDMLLAAFLRTAEEYQGSKDTLQRCLQEAIVLVKEDRLHFTSRRLTRFINTMAREGFPAAHHSAAYTRAYHPAYRVVARACLPGGWIND